jgi:hypothetical protein
MAHAKKKTTKPAGAKKGKSAPKPVPMVKLANGGERPETAADKRNAAHMAKMEKRQPDGAKAFHLVGGMEDSIRRAQGLCDAIYSIGVQLADHFDRLAHAAITAAREVYDHLDQLEESRGKIWHATWGYAFGSKREAV